MSLPEGWGLPDMLGVSTQVITALVHQLGGTHRLLACASCHDPQGGKQLLIELALPGGPMITLPLTQRSLVLNEEPEDLPQVTHHTPTLEILAAWIQASIGEA